MNDFSDFPDPNHLYHGDYLPENLLFNANLREFSQQVSFICYLETNGKLSAEAAYEQISELWEKFKSFKKQPR